MSTVADAHKGPGILSIPTSENGKSYNVLDIVQFSKGSCLSSGK